MDKDKAVDKPNWSQMIRDSKYGSILVVLLTTGIVLLAVYWSGSGMETSANKPPQSINTAMGSAPAVGELAPNFTAVTMDGESVKLSERIGKPQWLIFTATWCTMCRAENPEIEQAYLEYKNDIDVIAVYSSEKEETIKSYTDKAKLTFPCISDQTNKIASQYRVMGLPMHYFISREGKISAIRVGVLSRAQVDQEIKKIVF